MSFSYNASLIEKWADARNLINGSTPLAQCLKSTEELGELLEAILSGDREAVADEMGDLLVTIIIVAAQERMDLSEVVRRAYFKIKDRGGLVLDGVFIKEKDLTPEVRERAEAQRGYIALSPTPEQEQAATELAVYIKSRVSALKGK